MRRDDFAAAPLGSDDNLLRDLRGRIRAWVALRLQRRTRIRSSIVRVEDGEGEDDDRGQHSHGPLPAVPQPAISVSTTRYASCSASRPVLIVPRWRAGALRNVGAGLAPPGKGDAANFVYLTANKDNNIHRA